MTSTMKDPMSLKSKPSKSVLLTLFLTLLTLAILLQNQPHPVTTTINSPPNRSTITIAPSLRPCGRIILISAPRHGSTWFISSADGCTARGSSNFGHLNSETELWVHNGMVKIITPSAAYNYVRTTRSLKVMPAAFFKHRQKLREFLRLVGDTVPVFVLRRRLEDCYASLHEAKASGRWMRNKINVTERTIGQVVNDDRFESYKRRIDTFFGEVKHIMEDAGNVWDEVEYEQVSLQRVIIGRRNRCFVKNCNFE